MENSSVWIIDDDEFSIHLNKMMLKSNNFSNITAYNNPLEALGELKRLYSNHSPLPEIILLDINMPFMNGFQFLEALTEEGVEMVNTKVFIVSSSINLSAEIDKYNSTIPISGFFINPLRSENVQEIINLIKYQPYFSII